MKSLLSTFPTFLVVVMVSANLACVCVAQAGDVPGDVHNQHDQHQQRKLPGSSIDEKTDCPHQSCDGSCGTFARPVDRDGAAKLGIRIDAPDDLEVSRWDVTEIRIGQVHHDPPPYLPLNLVARTPVQRKDLLLE